MAQLVGVPGGRNETASYHTFDAVPGGALLLDVVIRVCWSFLELEKRIRPYLCMSNGSWRVDETYCTDEAQQGGATGARRGSPIDDGRRLCGGLEQGAHVQTVLAAAWQASRCDEDLRGVLPGRYQPLGLERGRSGLASASGARGRRAGYILPHIGVESCLSKQQRRRRGASEGRLLHLQ
jgi:hypothetical protein